MSEDQQDIHQPNSNRDENLDNSVNTHSSSSAHDATEGITTGAGLDRAADRVGYNLDQHPNHGLATAANRIALNEIRNSQAVGQETDQVTGATDPQKDPEDDLAKRAEGIKSGMPES